MKNKKVAILSIIVLAVLGIGVATISAFSQKMIYEPGGGLVIGEPTIMDYDSFTEWAEARLTFCAGPEIKGVPDMWEHQFEQVLVEIENGATVILEDNGTDGFGWNIFYGEYEIATPDSFKAWAKGHSEIDQELFEQTLENIENGAEVLLFEDSFFDMSASVIFESEGTTIGERRTVGGITELDLVAFKNWVEESLDQMIASGDYTEEEVAYQSERYHNVLADFGDIEGIIFLISEEDDELWGVTLPENPVIMDYEKFKEWIEERITFEAEMGESELNLQRLRSDLDINLELLRTGELTGIVVADNGQFGYMLSGFSEEYIELMIEEQEELENRDDVIEWMLQGSDEETKQVLREFNQESIERFREQGDALLIIESWRGSAGKFW